METDRKEIVSPDQLIGYHAQIAFDGSEKVPNWKGLIFPIMEIVDYGYGKTKIETDLKTYTQDRPYTVFFAKPIGDVQCHEPVPDDDFRDISSICFYSLFEEYKPHYLLNDDYLEWFKSDSHFGTIPIRLHACSPINENKEQILDLTFVPYIGEAEFRLFIPFKGFLGEWPKKIPFSNELLRIEREWIEKKD